MGLLDEAIREHLELKRLRGADASEIARLEREALGPVRRGGDPVEEADGAEELGLASSGGKPGFDLLSAPGASASDDPQSTEAATHVHDPAHSEHEEAIDWEQRPAAPQGQRAPDPHHPVEGLGAVHVEPPAHGERGSAGRDTTEFDAQAAAADDPPAAVPPGPTEDPPTLAAQRPPSPPRPGAEDATIADADRGDAGSRDAEPVRNPRPAEPRPAEPPVHPSEEHEHPGPDAEQSAREGEPAEDVLEETPDFLQEAPEHDRLWFEQRPPRDFDFDK